MRIWLVGVFRMVEVVLVEGLVRELVVMGLGLLRCYQGYCRGWLN